MVCKAIADVVRAAAGMADGMVSNSATYNESFAVNGDHGDGSNGPTSCGMTLERRVSMAL